VDVDPSEVDAAIERVAVAASLDGSGPATFGALGPLRLDVAVGGTPVAVFEPDGLGAETALLCVEIYRRDRLEGVCGGSGLRVRAGRRRHRLRHHRREAGGATARTDRKGDPRQGEGVAPQAPDRVADQGRQLRPAAGRHGAGLGPGARGRSIDLDASAILVGEDGRKVDAVWFMSKEAFGGRVQHSGDNLTGHGEGDDEAIRVDLEQLPSSVAAIVFVVNSFQGQRFTEVSGAYCRLVDLTSGAELVRFDLSDSAPRTGVVMSVLHRAGATWEMTAIGEFHDGRSARTMYGVAEDVVRGLGRSESGT
jgi:stress response protein SCP2